MQDRAAANLKAGPGVAVREFPLKGGPVDYLLYVDGAAVGAVEAKKEGWTLSGVEAQSRRHSEGLPDALPPTVARDRSCMSRPASKTMFTNLFDPEPRSREVFLTAANFTYRLAKFGKAKRILFLVDRGNLGRQARKEFEQFRHASGSANRSCTLRT